MTRSVFAIALLVCALVAASMAQDTITIPAGAGAYVFTGTAANWNAGTNTYSGAGPLTITFSPAGATSTNVNAITVSSSAAVTISNSGSVNAGLSIAAGGSLTVAAGAAPSFNAVNPGGSLNIPATASLTVTNTLNGNPSTLNVAGTLTATNGFTFNNIATPTFATTTVITATNNINLGFTSSVNFPAGGSISSSGGAVSVNTVGGTIAGSLTNSGGAVTVAGALTSALTVSGAVSASGAVSVTPTGAQNVAVSGAVNAGANGVTVSNNNAPSVSVSGAVSTSGAATITGNAATATVTLSGATTASSLTISANGGTNGAVTLSGAATLTGALTLSATGNAASSIVASSAVAGATTVALNTPGSISVPSTGQIAFTGALTLGSSPSSINVAGKLLGTTTSATATVVLNPTGAATVSGTITSGTAANSLQLNAGAASTISGTLQSGSTIVFGSTAGAFGSTTYSINGGTLNFATSVNFNSPTTFNGVTFVAPQWNVQVSGGSSASGPTSQYTLTASGNTINSSLFPSGSNTNCVWVQSYSGSTVSSFLVSLPGNIQYRNYVSASPTALTVSSTNGGTVSFCTPNIQSTFDRRNDLNRNNLVYFGGNVVYYFTTSQALPFGAITPSDFTVTGGVISSISTIGGSSPAAYQIVVQITCDGVVNLAYNGSWTTPSGTFLGEVSLGNVRVVSAKCISNIYAPCG